MVMFVIIGIVANIECYVDQHDIIDCNLFNLSTNIDLNGNIYFFIKLIYNALSTYESLQS